jgi:hypothetical protein
MTQLYTENNGRAPTLAPTPQAHRARGLGNEQSRNEYIQAVGWCAFALKPSSEGA